MNHKGFTLIELLVCIVIVIILAIVVAMPIAGVLFSGDQTQQVEIVDQKRPEPIEEKVEIVDQGDKKKL